MEQTLIVMEKNRVLLFQRIIPSYRIPLFHYLYDKFGIIVCHSKEGRRGKIKGDIDNLTFPTEIIQRLYYQYDETAVIQNAFAPLFKYKPKVVISQFSVKYLTFWLLLFLKPFFRYQLIVWTHGIKSNEINTPFKGLRGKISLWVFRNIDGIILYTYGIKKIIDATDKVTVPIFVAQNTLDVNTYKEHIRRFEDEGRVAIKKELGFISKYNLIYIGRLLKSKRIDLLLESFMLIAERFDISLHIIGEGAESDLVRQYQMKCKRINHYGAIYDDLITGKFLYCSDVMVMPGYVGLSIVHSFAFGLPIVTCRTTEDGPFHSPEIEYLEDGVNGFFCDQTSQDISRTIEDLLLDENKLFEFKANALNTAYNKCNVDNFVKGFESALLKL